MAAPRAPWSDGKDLFDTPQVQRKRFNVDWQNLLSIGLAKQVAKANQVETEEAAAEDVQRVAEILWENYGLCFQLFTYYSCLEGAFNWMTLNVWTKMLEDCGLVDNSSQFCKKAHMDNIFVAVDTAENKAEKDRNRAFDRQKQLSRVEFNIL